MVLVFTGVSNIFYFAYVLIILLEKIFSTLISKLLNKAMILFKYFTFFKHVLHSKRREASFNFKFSTWKKITPKYHLTYFTLTHNGNQTLVINYSFKKFHQKHVRSNVKNVIDITDIMNIFILALQGYKYASEW